MSRKRRQGNWKPVQCKGRGEGVLGVDGGTVVGQAVQEQGQQGGTSQS